MVGPHGPYQANNPNYPGELKNRFSLVDGETVKQSVTRKGYGAAFDIAQKQHRDPAAVMNRFGFSQNENLRAEEISVDDMVRADASTPMSNPGPKVQQA